MNPPEGSSLLDFVDSPVIVGDPDSRVIYVNPSCERRLGIVGAVARGETLSSLFEGGSREAVLKAVAEVCTHGKTSHFKLREGGGDFLAQASPIEAEGDRVGVVILMTDEPAPRNLPRSLPVQLLEETIACLQEVAAATSDPDQSDAIERSLAGLQKLEKLASSPRSEPEAVMGGGRRSEPALDPVRVAWNVAEKVGRELAQSGCDLELLVPQKLPAARGDAGSLEAALVKLVRQRIGEARENSHFTLSARVIGAADRRSVLFSVVHSSGSDAERVGGEVVTEPAPREIRDQIEELGGSLYSIASERLGRVTSIQLPLLG